MNRVQFRLLVARALRQLHDPLLLADSPLVRILGIEVRGDPAAAGEALRGQLLGLATGQSEATTHGVNCSRGAVPLVSVA